MLLLIKSCEKAFIKRKWIKKNSERKYKLKCGLIRYATKILIWEMYVEEEYMKTASYTKKILIKNK